MDNCIFCRIIRGEVPSKTVFENEHFKVMLDIGPASRGHVLILPKEHYSDLFELPEELAAEVLPLARKIASGVKKAFRPAGVKLVQNNGAMAGQTVMHFHLHIIPCYDGTEVGEWKPGSPSAEELEIIQTAIKEALA